MGEGIREEILSLAPHTLHAHVHGVDASAGGDEEGVAVFAAEADVAGPVFLDVDVEDLFAGFVEDGDAFAGEVDVAFIVDGHAIGAEFAEEFFVGEFAIRFDGVGIGFVAGNV
jgi:hypothetical protein